MRVETLVTLALSNGTVLHSVLARYIGLHLTALTSDQVDQLVRTCEKHLTTGRPWDMGIVLHRFA